MELVSQAATNLSPESPSEFTQFADDVHSSLRQQVGEAVFKNWLLPLKLLSITSSTVLYSLPTTFMKRWVLNNYGDSLIKLWRDKLPTVSAIEINVIEAAASPSPTSAPLGEVKSTNKNISLVDTEVADASKNALLGAPLDPRYTFDHFVVGNSNELAFAAAKRVAQSRIVPFNPLFLYGGVGLGKTHLMHAIAWEITVNQPDRRVVYLSAEKFMYQFIRALRYKDTMAFKDYFRNIDVLMIDDLQFIGGKESTQEEFFHTFNALVDQNRQVIVSADKSPSDLEGLEERLRSRLGWGLVADIHPTTYELRMGIIQSKLESLDITFPDKVCEFLAHTITSNIRELEGALNRLAAHANLVGRKITLDAAQEVLRDLLRAHTKLLTIEEIQKTTAAHFNVRISDLHSARRSRTIARPRQIAMFLAKRLTDKSLPEIGRKFGGRDHTTVMHAVRSIEKLVQEDSEIRENVELLQKMLEN